MNKNTIEITKEEYDQLNIQIKKNLLRLRLYEKWLEKRNNQKKISTYLYKNNFDCISVYGLGSIGERILEEVLSDDVKVEYIIDSRFVLQGGKYDGIPVIRIDLLERFSKKTQLVIVSIVEEFDEIKKNINMFIPDLKVMSVSEIIDKI
ncbi:MAG: hypothetical protein ACD_79C00287G0015 [uncultured bacterium]|nr:MAG: hypothetical protein ACD_79C00287G0015 [uncultured bacterium]